MYLQPDPSARVGLYLNFCTTTTKCYVSSHFYQEGHPLHSIWALGIEHRESKKPKQLKKKKHVSKWHPNKCDTPKIHPQTDRGALQHATFVKHVMHEQWTLPLHIHTVTFQETLPHIWSTKPNWNKRNSTLQSHSEKTINKHCETVEQVAQALMKKYVINPQCGMFFTRWSYTWAVKCTVVKGYRLI